MKLLILGANGNLARLTTHALRARYPEVQLRLTSHRAEGIETLRSEHPSTEVIGADWYDERSLRDAFIGVDKALIVTPDFTTDETVVTPNLIRAARANGRISHIVRFIAIPPGLTSRDLTPAELETRCGAAQHLVAKPLWDASGLPTTYVNAACWIMFNLPWFMAEDVKQKRQLVMPSSADAARLWISESDLADIFTKILTDAAADHTGREYLVTAGERYDFLQLAALLGKIIGEPVSYIDSDSALRRSMGPVFPALMTYFGHETKAYIDVPTTRDIEKLLGRAATSLPQYIVANRHLFS